MAYVPRSSFIPKETTGAIPMQMRKRRTIHIFGLLSTIMLVASLVSAGGVYFYTGLLEGQLESAQTELGEISSTDNERKIDEVRVYDQKLSIAHTLLNNHLATSHIFEELENSTKETVQFNSLSFKYDPGFKAELTLSGNTEEFSSIALQKMQLLEDTFFTEFVLGDITNASEVVTSDGKASTPVESNDSTDGVGFSVTGIFKKGILEYTGKSNNSGSSVEPKSVPDADEVTTSPVDATKPLVPLTTQ